VSLKRRTKVNRSGIETGRSIYKYTCMACFSIFLVLRPLLTYYGVHGDGDISQSMGGIFGI
jgi:hypothetical protein